jgi:hypothetical protein
MYEAEVARVTPIQKYHRNELLRRENVTGVGTGLRRRSGGLTDEVCVVIYVVRKLPLSELAPEDVLPTILTGPDGDTVRTDVQQSGVIRPLSYTGQYPTMIGGISIGPQGAQWYGTAGGLLVVAATGADRVLTNNHVVTTNGVTIASQFIVQPGTSQNVVAEVDTVIPIQTSPNDFTAPMNAMDAATIKLTPNAYVWGLEGLEGCVPFCVLQSPSLNQLVWKVGATTEFTQGKVTGVDTGFIGEWFGAWAGFENVFTVESEPDPNWGFSQPGDSGSFVFINPDTQPPNPANPPLVGLLFAGGGNITYCTDITVVAGTIGLEGFPLPQPDDPKKIETVAFLDQARSWLGRPGTPVSDISMARARIVLHRLHHRYADSPAMQTTVSSLLRIFALLNQQPEIRRLVMEAVTPLLFLNEKDLLNAVMDEERVLRFMRLGAALERADSALAPLGEVIRGVAARSTGARMADVFERH